MRPEDDDLLIRYLDSELAPDEAGSLEVRLKAERRLAERLIVLSRDVVVMAEWSTATASPAQPARPAAAPDRQRRMVWIPAFALLIACGLTIYGLSLVNDVEQLPPLLDVAEAPAAPDTDRAIVGRLEEVQGDAYLLASNGQSIRLVKGQEIRAGQQVQTGGGSVAVVRLPDSTRLEIGTDTLLKVIAQAGKALDSTSEFMLVSGVLYADVSAHSEGKGVLLNTPHATIKSDGSRFSSATVGETTSVETETGKVEMTMGTGPSVDVQAGRSVVAGNKGKVTDRAMPPSETKFRASFQVGTGPTLGVTTARVGNVLAVQSWEGPVYFLDLKADRTLPPWMAHDRNLRSISMSTDGKWLATGADEKFSKVKLFDIENQREVLNILKPRTGVESVAISPDGKRLVSGGGIVKGAAEVTVWDASMGLELGSLTGHTHPVKGVAFQPTGETIATVGNDGQLRIFDAATFAPVGTHSAHSGEANALAFSPDGSILATAGKDRLILLWDTKTWTIRATLEGHLNEVRALAFTADGKRLASSGGGNTVWLWDVMSAMPVRTFIGHKFKVTGVAFSADGRTLATSGWDRTVKLWNVAP